MRRNGKEEIKKGEKNNMEGAMREEYGKRNERRRDPEYNKREENRKKRQQNKIKKKTKNEKVWKMNRSLDRRKREGEGE
jgi:hypothetical protein